MSNQKPRKINQIVSNIDNSGRYFVLAVCDDGTLWQLAGLYEGIPSWKSFVAPSINDVETVDSVKKEEEIVQQWQKSIDCHRNHIELNWVLWKLGIIRDESTDRNRESDIKLIENKIEEFKRLVKEAGFYEANCRAGDAGLDSILELLEVGYVVLNREEKINLIKNKIEKFKDEIAAENQRRADGAGDFDYGPDSYYKSGGKIPSHLKEKDENPANRFIFKLNDTQCSVRGGVLRGIDVRNCLPAFYKGCNILLKGRVGELQDDEEFTVDEPMLEFETQPLNTNKLLKPKTPFTYYIDNVEYGSFFSTLRGIDIRNSLPPEKKSYEIYLHSRNSDPEVGDYDEFDLTGLILGFETEKPYPVGA